MGQLFCIIHWIFSQAANRFSFSPQSQITIFWPACVGTQNTASRQQSVQTDRSGSGRTAVARGTKECQRENQFHWLQTVSIYWVVESIKSKSKKRRQSNWFFSLFSTFSTAKIQKNAGCQHKEPRKRAGWTARSADQIKPKSEAGEGLAGPTPPSTIVQLFELSSSHRLAERSTVGRKDRSQPPRKEWSHEIVPMNIIGPKRSWTDHYCAKTCFSLSNKIPLLFIVCRSFKRLFNQSPIIRLPAIGSGRLGKIKRVLLQLVA